MSWHCSHCDFSSFSEGSRDSHTSDVHKVSQEFVCPHENCSKKFDRVYHLNRHIKTDHDSKTFHIQKFKQKFWEFSFVCHTCGKKFGQRESLRRHESIHSTERLPCGLPGCNIDFPSNRVNYFDSSFLHFSKILRRISGVSIDKFALSKRQSKGEGKNV